MIVLQIVSEHEAADTVSRGSGIMLPENWILKRDVDRGVLDYYS